MAIRLTAGPDGALWFTALETSAGTQTGKIGRITTSGTVTYFQPSGHTFIPRDITTGPDGALWFTEMSQFGGSDHIGRMTTAGVFSEYPLPSPTYANASAITSGPESTLWYVESGPKGTANKLVRMTTTGTATEFTLGDSNATAGVLTTGADGALWFGAWFGEGRLARITTAGQITYVTPITAGNAIRDMTVGPNGRIWFTEACAFGSSKPNGANGKIGMYG